MTVPALLMKALCNSLSLRQARVQARGQLFSAGGMTTMPAKPVLPRLCGC